ncbi:MAG: ABC transporter permease [Acidimicrobiia bacterium]
MDDGRGFDDGGNSMVMQAVVRRLLGLPLLLLLITLATFSLTLLLPGDPAEAAAGSDPTPAQIALARKVLNLDDPAPLRFVKWLGNAATGDFGTSAITGRSITEEIKRRLPITATIGLLALLFAILLGTVTGVVQALFANRLPDRLLGVGVSLGLAIPNFWLATIFVAYFAVQLKWLPAIGYVGFGTDPVDWARHLVLPVLTLALFPAAELARQIRTGLLRVVDADYIRAASARGLSKSRVIGKHALKNAAAPAVTILGLRVGYLFAGSVVIENIFSIPGFGAYTLQAIQNRDVPVIQAVVLMSAIIVVLVSLIVDIVYTLLNPKVAIA